MDGCSTPKSSGAATAAESSKPRVPQRGAAKVAPAMLALMKRPPRGAILADVNGMPRIVMRDADGLLSVVAFEVDHGLITAIHSIPNPEKLQHVTAPF